MYFKKKIRQGISTALIAVMSLSNGISALAATQPRTSVDTDVTVTNSNYKATVDLTNGGVLRSKRGDVNTNWNTVSEDLVPGATMLLDGDNQVIQGANISAKNVMTTGNGSIGASGLELDGDLSGVKSYFMFDNEILCLGAGLENVSEEGGSLATVVDNIPVDSTTRVALTTPAKALDLPTRSAWSTLKGGAVQQKESNGRNWLASSDAAKGSGELQWHYIFKDSLNDSNVFCRFPTNTGTITAVEIWTKNGTAYAYTMGTGKEAGTSALPASNPAATDNKILLNTAEIQAAENTDEGVLMLNKWSTGETILENSIAKLNLNQPASIVIKKDAVTEKTQIIVAKPSASTDSYIEFTAALLTDSITEINGTNALVDSNIESNRLYVKLDTSKMSGPITLEASYKLPDAAEGDEITLIRGGDSVLIEVPDGFQADKITWSPKFVVKDENGNEKYLRNSGWSKIKRELEEGESDGTRVAGDTSAEHLVNITKLTNGNVVISGKEKGIFTLVADDGTQKKHFKVEVLYTDPVNLPEVTEEDYLKIRRSWKESLIGVNLKNEEGGMEIIAEKEAAAKTAWDSYNYKGQEACGDIPFVGNAPTGAAKDFKDDAVAQRKAFKSVQAMAYGYALDGSQYYKNQELFKDIVNALDYLCGKCYTPKSQANNWYAWEIGIPSDDLLPTLMLLSEELTDEQLELYTEGMYFFQPDPFHGGVIGDASTQGSGYRLNQGSNQTLCAKIAIGIGALRKDNEEVYLGALGASDVFVIQSVEDSTKIASTGYTSGFYSDGSYLDHLRVPYIGGYGIDFMNTAIEIPSLIGGTSWTLAEEAQANMESYISDGFGSSMYRGMMLDSLKGRSISRKAETNQGTGRNAMKIVLKLVDNLRGEQKATMLSALKYWLEQDPDFIDTMTSIADLSAKKKAREILEDNSIEPYVAPMHKSFSLMDRVVHRTDNYLFSVSMYSERIQNTEIMNHENRLGWHQNNGMTYLYDEDRDQYSDNFWNTVNPLRLPGTTVVPVNIGTGGVDSSGWAQGGDFCSPESWVGGSVIDNYGISGMAMSGEINGSVLSGASVDYAPNLRGKKSWFMFETEIVCLGAGITNSGMNLPVETTIENHRLDEAGDNTFLVNGKETNLPLKEANIMELVERSVDVSGTEFNGVEWAHLEGNGDSEGIGYYFPEEDTQIQARRARTTGDWSDIGTSQGESTQNYLEMWFDHGQNPSDASYSYVLLPESSAEDTEEYANAPKATVLANTSSVQAVYQQELGITGINFWENKETTVADVTCDSQASVMLQETEDGHLKVAVSDPTMKNTGSIKLTINRPISAEISSDNQVDCTLNENGSATLTFRMRGSNGASLNAELQLKASIYPSAVTLRKGDEQAFEVRAFDGSSEAVSWSVDTAKNRMASGTAIDENGLLSVAEKETDDALLITAKRGSAQELHAYVSLGKDAASKLPEETPEQVTQIQNLLGGLQESLENASDNTEQAVVEAVKEAVKAVQNVDSEVLVKHLTEEVQELVTIYKEVWQANGWEIEESVDDNSADGLTVKDATGMILSLYTSTNLASSSNAVLALYSDGAEYADVTAVAYADIDESEEITVYAEDSIIDEDILDEDEGYVEDEADDEEDMDEEAEEATPSNATPSNAESKGETELTATPSNAELPESEMSKATPSNAISDKETSHSTPKTAVARIAVPSKLDGKKIDTESFCGYLLKLFREYDTDEKSGVRQLLNMKGFIKLEISVPEQLDMKKPIVAVVEDYNGKQHKVDFELNEEEETMTLYLTRMGTLMFANRYYEIQLDDKFVGGTVTANRLSGAAGTEIILTVTADKGYELDYLKVNGELAEVTDGKYTFTLENDTIIVARFKKVMENNNGNGNNNNNNHYNSRYDDDDDDDYGYTRSYEDSGSWIDTGDGWKYQTPSGNYVTDSWYIINGQWYAFDANGNMRTGWHMETLDSHWYYLKADGMMATGWQYINGKWYYFNPVTIGTTGWTDMGENWQFETLENAGMPKGAMYRGQMTPDGYLVDADGAWILQ